MTYARYPFVPGPVTLHQDVLQAMSCDYGSGQIEADFLSLYAETTTLLQGICETKNSIVLMTGEGMLALWSALKSCLRAGDPVLCIGTGVFGDGFAPMAESIGCNVELLSFPHNSTINSAQALEKIEEAIKRFRPKMITAVHCETPSGTLNPLVELGKLKKLHNVPLLYVDAVASAGGVPVGTDMVGIDLLLVGSQKCLSAPPSMSIVAVSDTAWDVMSDIAYQGYDAILPFRSIMEDGRCPYTPYWHGVAALHAAAKALVSEGLHKVYARHEKVAAFCREGLQDMGVRLFPAAGACASPTVTAAYIPEGYTWNDWQSVLRHEGLIVAGSFGAMQGKVFRLGHMGTQAHMDAMDGALEIIKRNLRKK